MSSDVPSVRQRRIGRELRGWRDERGMTLEQVTKPLGWQVNRLSRYERAERKPAPSDIIAVATILGVAETERDRVVELARQAQAESGWWTSYAKDVVPHYLADLLETERDSVAVQAVETTLIPGLLQTDSYIDTLMGGEADEKRQVRRQRQQRLDNPDPVRLHAVIHEAAFDVLARGCDANVISEQRDHLLSRAAQHNVTIQVVPFEAGVYPGIAATWSAYSYDGQQFGVVFIDNLRGGLYVEEPELVDTYFGRFATLTKLAMDPEASTLRLQDIGR